ncbi:MAG TPA: hypothetical protein VFK04_10460 [Gemmatimonadaceae bacterium]|nr:hypothetical protein [Gemmatimonadaceae bacterium]
MRTQQLLWLVPLIAACSDGNSGPAPITCATASNSRQTASVVDLQPGQSVSFLTSAAAAGCLEIEPQANSRYILGVFNATPTASSAASVTITGGTPAAVQADLVARSRASAGGAGNLRSWLLGTSEHAQRNADRLHREVLEADRRLVQRRGNPRAAFARVRAREERSGARLQRAPVSRAISPKVGDLLPFHIRDIDQDVGDTICVKGFDIQARTVYVGEKSILFEDVDSPVKGQIDEFYQSIGAEFDNTIYPMLVENFGDPLAFDQELGATGKVLMLFSPVLNQHFGGVAGFVSGCDFYPYDPEPGPDQNTVGNEAAIFYAYVPDDATMESIDRWQAFVRGVLAHESKHLSSYAAKFENGATSLEEGWLEESTAQIASEIYQRTFSHSPWKNPTSFLASVGCEPPLTARNGCSGDHPQVMLHHFSFLYDYLDNGRSESPIGSSGNAYYGGAWSFVRWTIDQYAPSESGILHAMTQSTTSFGVANILTRINATFPELVANWSLASAVAGESNFAPENPLLTFPSWKQGEIFAGMHDELILASTGDPAFPLTYPLVPDTASFGDFVRGVIQLHGGGVALFDLSSTTADRQPIEITLTSGAPLPVNSPVRTAIVRVK